MIAVKADPPEAVPGASVTLTPLVVSPTGELEEGEGYRADWWRCPDVEASPFADEERCAQPAARVPLGGGAPIFSSIPDDLFAAPVAGSDDPVTELARAAFGYWRVVGLTMRAGERVVEAVKRVVVFPSALPLGGGDDRLAALDVRVDDEGRVVPNANPLLLGVEVRAGERDGPPADSLEPGGTYWLRPTYDEGALQEYFSLHIDLAGLDLENAASLRELSEGELIARSSRVRRCEIPVFSWFVTGGQLQHDTSLDERVVKGVYLEERGVRCPAAEGTAEGAPRRPEVRYIAPKGADAPPGGVVRAWVVMRDGRGGTAFTSFEMHLE